MKEKELYELKESLVNELANYSRERLDKRNICEIDLLAHATKNVCKIIEAMVEEEEGYSSYRNGGGSSRRSYARGDGNSSYAREGGSSRRYSGNSYHSPRELVDELRNLMEDAPDEASRQDFQRLIMKLESM